MSSQATLIIAHGSRQDSANKEVINLAAQLSQELSQEVLVAFLEIATPAIPEALEQLLSKEFSTIKVLPYFLAGGKHSLIDIPKFIEEFQKANPQVQIELLDYYGKHAEHFTALKKVLDYQT